MPDALHWLIRARVTRLMAMSEGSVSSVRMVTAACGLLAPIDLVRAARDHRRTKMSDNASKGVGLEDPFPPRASKSRAQKVCSATKGLPRIGTASNAVAKAVRRLYRPPHVAASSALLGHYRGNGDAEAARLCPWAAQK